LAKRFGKTHNDTLKFIDNYLKIHEELTHLLETSTYNDVYYRDKRLLLIHGELEDNIIKKLEGFLRLPTSAREKVALNTIEQLLGVKLDRQFRVGNYRIDGYCKETNIAYEIDEHQHKSSRHKKDDEEREKFIISKLGCTFKRISI
jgi:very-short-patch-repair endonuclease